MNNQTINEIYKRDLDKVFFSFSILSQDVFFNFGNDYIKKRTIYTIIGTNINGVRKYITSIFDDDYTKSSDWYNLLLAFKKRGLEHIFFVSMPNNPLIKNAFDLTFPNISFFYSCSNIINKLSHYMSCSYSNNIFNMNADGTWCDTNEEKKKYNRAIINMAYDSFKRGNKT